MTSININNFNRMAKWERIFPENLLLIGKAIEVELVLLPTPTL